MISNYKNGYLICIMGYTRVLRKGEGDGFGGWVGGGVSIGPTVNIKDGSAILGV